MQAKLRLKELEGGPPVAPYSASFGRSLVRSVLGGEDGGMALVGRTLRVGGWVKTGREAGAGAFAFLEVNDGTCMANLQVGWAVGGGGGGRGGLLHVGQQRPIGHPCLCLSILHCL